jgi:hypothetical protein
VLSSHPDSLALTLLCIFPTSRCFILLHDEAHYGLFNQLKAADIYISANRHVCMAYRRITNLNLHIHIKIMQRQGATAFCRCWNLAYGS